MQTSEYMPFYWIGKMWLTVLPVFQWTTVFHLELDHCLCLHVKQEKLDSSWRNITVLKYQVKNLPLRMILHPSFHSLWYRIKSFLEVAYTEHPIELLHASDRSFDEFSKKYEVLQTDSKECLAATSRRKFTYKKKNSGLKFLARALNELPC